jgi:uncharacterized protein
MTTALDFPFRFENGKLAATSNYSRIVRNQLIDTLMTNFRERVMRPDYGSDIQSLLFNQSDELQRGDTASIIQERLSYAVPRALIDSVEIRPDPQSKFVVYITVSYRVNEFSEPEAVTIPVSGGSDG